MITTSGAFIHEFPVPTPGNVVDIRVGPDGNLWFTEQQANKIGRITTSGTFAEFTVPTSGSFPTGISAGPARSASVWFTEFNGNKIGEVSTK